MLFIIIYVNKDDIMDNGNNHFNNIYEQTKKLVGYKTLKQCTPLDYKNLGFKSGLEVHQQLYTDQKLFCRCPAGMYFPGDDYDAEVIRHMRPTLSELGEYDGTALMEFKTKKNITYRIKNPTTCTYEIDDTPPFPINQQALDIALEVALLLKTNVVGELHITRKQYLDGSIPTGFQRTAIVGIEGEIPLAEKKVRIIQLSLEEDACREVSDFRHQRIYTTDRLGMPLIETVTYPDLLTPQEVVEVGNYIRFMNRSTGKVRTGIGATRQDVNVSISGGTRVEIKGVAHIKWFAELVHNEAFRQKSLLQISSQLKQRIKDIENWDLTYQQIDPSLVVPPPPSLKYYANSEIKWMAVNLPQFQDILAHFTQPGQVFGDELRGRLKVISCLELDNMIHSQDRNELLSTVDFSKIRKILKAKPMDAQLLFWTPPQDLNTALDTIRERCILAYHGVPNETRKARADGTTVFERVLPGPDRMYPDTDSAPLPIDEQRINKIQNNLPPSIHCRYEQLNKWKVPRHYWTYLLRHNLIPIIEKIIDFTDYSPKFLAGFFAQDLKHLEGQNLDSNFNYPNLISLFKFISNHNLSPEIAKLMLPVVFNNPNIELESVLTIIKYQKRTIGDILSFIPALRKKFNSIAKNKNIQAERNWIMGNLKLLSIGNYPLDKLKEEVNRRVK